MSDARPHEGRHPEHGAAGARQAGKPAADAATKLPCESDEKLIAFYKAKVKELGGEEPKGNPHVPTAALILGTIGRPDSPPALLEALKGEKDDTNRAVIARELAKIPATPESIAAFKSTRVAYAGDRDPRAARRSRR